MSETILEEANRLIQGPRGADYGHPLDEYGRVVGAFNALTGHDLTAEEGALFMVCLKAAREVNRSKRDNRVDGAGYFAVLDMIVTEREKRKASA